MNRRTILSTIAGVTTPTALAGCSQLSQEQNTQTPDSDSNPNSQENNDPTVTWEETWLQGEKYRLTVSGEFRGADQIQFKRINQTVATITANNDESYSQTIAGPNTEFGPVKLGDMITAKVPDGEFSWTVDMFSVGSQDQASFPAFLMGLSAGTIPDIENSNTIERRFSQTVDGEQTVLTTQVPETLYNYYKNRKRTRDWGGYVSAGYDDPYIQSIVDDLRDYGNRRGYSDRQIVNHAVAFVQQMEYTQDKAATGYTEYPKYPIETLVDRGGDCEDSVILLAQMLQKLGYGTVLLVIPAANHMALGVAGGDSLPGAYYEYEGQKYYYLETTSGGWKVGELPDSVREAQGQAKIVEVNSRPVLAHKWGVQVPSEGGAEVTVGLRNTGDAPASSAEVEIQFETQSGNVVARKRKSAPRIDASTVREVALRLSPPDDKPLRGRVRIYLDGNVHDESVSGFAEPFKPSGNN